ncbi:MAG: two-component system response regulator [Desulfobulbaceae bacterium]|nr:MAG: two-component system response regulator [Desulfobulbaceae bacterium]
MSPTGTQRLLIVDDTPLNITILGDALADQYELIVATNGQDALRLAGQQPLPDLILLDVMMPGMDGYTVCRHLKENSVTRHIPVIFVTAKSDVTSEKKGFELGAVDYISKPVSPPLVRARVRTHLALYDQTRHLEELVELRTREVLLARDATIHGLAVLAETRDNETGAHITRTRKYVRSLAEHLAGTTEFADQFNDEIIDLLDKSAPLHDIGKVGVPDSILLKPGKLTAEEFEEMKKHTTYGRDALVAAEQVLGADTQNTFLSYAKEIAYCHHEKWDGSGYPQGLQGVEIPLSARLMALADVYDALISKRVYKEAFSHDKAVAIIRRGEGSHFDPAICAAFLILERQFQAIGDQHRD